eukprot:CAMPEP_0172174816 /NCGR_PEP_ID=MMETSP1050-20130122/13879_1 /TAXON_ID=233186 /ORGANISM="Cryptomonas curvata, Strain CCAP979/52" /LENGTH=319 /DNA_ID=CAMNT_0012846843 /DNA_START=27 /DNA_END=981 /DNA_ORIENTATION=-
MERWLFHGPGTLNDPAQPQQQGGDPLQCIVEEGFQPLLAGSRTGAVYGAGTYFARDSAYSDGYARRAADGTSCIIMSRRGAGAVRCGAGRDGAAAPAAGPRHQALPQPGKQPGEPHHLCYPGRGVRVPGVRDQLPPRRARAGRGGGADAAVRAGVPRERPAAGRAPSPPRPARQRQDRAAAVAALAKRRAAAAAAAAAAAGGSGKECSGQECSDAWGQLGIGDQMVDPQTGKGVPGRIGVGPKSGLVRTGQDGLDRQVDPRTGEELPGCVGPQCDAYQLGIDDPFKGGLDTQVPAPVRPIGPAGSETGPDRWDRYAAPP